MKIDYNSYRTVGAFNKRARFLILHYTALDFRASVEALTGNRVSAHYLVPDPHDASYIAAGFTDMRVFNLVDEVDRAWHAGLSNWAGRSGLNDTAIGIEIVNQATDDNGTFHFPPYPDEQIDALIELCRNILLRYPDITPRNVVGHSDIAIGRKSDPGAAFPWKKLHDHGIGAWYDDCAKSRFECRFAKRLPKREDVVEKLKAFGYDTSGAADATVYKNTLRALQLHFRPSNYDGKLDAETAAILYALVERYVP